MGIKRYSDIASMQNPGSQRTGQARGGRILRTADALAPLAAAHATGSLLGAVAYPGIKAAYKNITGKPGQKRRKKRQERRTARRGN